MFDSGSDLHSGNFDDIRYTWDIRSNGEVRRSEFDPADIQCTPYIVNHNGTTDYAAYVKMSNWYNQSTDYKYRHPLMMRMINSGSEWLYQFDHYYSNKFYFYQFKPYINNDSGNFRVENYVSYEICFINSSGQSVHTGPERISTELTLDYGASNSYVLVQRKAGDYSDGGSYKARVEVKYTFNNVVYRLPLVAWDKTSSPYKYVFATTVDKTKYIEATLDSSNNWTSRVVDTSVVTKATVTGTLDNTDTYTVDIPLKQYSIIEPDTSAVALVMNIPAATSGELDEASFKICPQGGLLSTVEFIQDGYQLPIIGTIPQPLSDQKQYQGTVVDGVVTFAEVDLPTPIT